MLSVPFCQLILKVRQLLPDRFQVGPSHFTLGLHSLRFLTGDRTNFHVLSENDDQQQVQQRRQLQRQAARVHQTGSPAESASSRFARATVSRTFCRFSPSRRN